MGIVFFDMDGVLADWNRGVAKLFDIDYEYLMKSWDPNVYYIEQIIGIPTEILWGKINEAGVAFWSELKAYEEAKMMWDYSISLGLETYILSSPSPNHSMYSVPGKIIWLREFTGDKNFSKAYFSSHKHLLAREDRVLIDDLDKNINMFKSAGGKTILYPRRWNSLHKLEDEAPRIVKYQLDELVRTNFA